jgi:hypothetical protein
MTARARVVALLIACLLPGCVGLAEHAADHPGFWKGVLQTAVCTGQWAGAQTSTYNGPFGPR